MQCFITDSVTGLPSGYLNWFLSYLTNRQLRVRYSGRLSSPVVVQSGVPQGSGLGPMLCNILENNLCDIIITPSFFFLLTTLKSIEQLVHLVIVYFYSQNVYINGDRQIL
jgi:hypothetical protein